MKTDLFQSCGHCCVFQICWHIECSTFTASFFRIWNSPTGIPSPHRGVPHSSVGKEPSCNVGDPGSIPGLGRSTGEGIGYPLQNYWASLVAQLVKNLPAMWETWVWTLGWEHPLEKGKATHSSILENSMDCSPWGRGHKESDTTLFHSINMYVYTCVCVNICP